MPSIRRKQADVTATGCEHVLRVHCEDEIKKQLAIFYTFMLKID